MFPTPTPQQIEDALLNLTAPGPATIDPDVRRRAVFLLLSTWPPQPSLDIGWLKAAGQ